jgi:hypothetical protein
MDRDMYSAIEIIAGIAAGFLLVGVIGLRWRAARYAVVALGPLYSIAVLVYFLAAGAGSTCSGQGATFQCFEVSYASTWGVLGSVVVGATILLSFAPVLSTVMRARWPSLIAAVALAALIGIYLLGLWVWLPDWAGVLGAAIAGPPVRRPRPAPAPSVDPNLRN